MSVHGENRSRNASQHSAAAHSDAGYSSVSSLKSSSSSSSSSVLTKASRKPAAPPAPAVVSAAAVPVKPRRGDQKERLPLRPVTAPHPGNSERQQKSAATQANQIAKQRLQRILQERPLPLPPKPAAIPKPPPASTARNQPRPSTGQPVMPANPAAANKGGETKSPRLSTPKKALRTTLLAPISTPQSVRQRHAERLAAERPAEEKRSWDESATVASSIHEYSSLRDKCLGNFFAHPDTRRLLLHTGVITEDGRIVELNRAFGRVIIAERRFKEDERTVEKQRAEAEFLKAKLHNRVSTQRRQSSRKERVQAMRTEEMQRLRARHEFHEELLRRAGVALPSRASPALSHGDATDAAAVPATPGHPQSAPQDTARPAPQQEDARVRESFSASRSPSIQGTPKSSRASSPPSSPEAPTSPRRAETPVERAIGPNPPPPLETTGADPQTEAAAPSNSPPASPKADDEEKCASDNYASDDFDAADSS
jgi:hypothetical protein